MMPPPMATSRFGTSGMSTASRALQTFLPSILNPGISMGRAPVATMKAGASTRTFSPPPSTSTAFAETKRALPFTTSTPFPFSRKPTPPVIFLTTSFLKARSLSMSTRGSPARMPRSPACRMSSTRLAAAMSALEGMHPQFRHTPPSSSRSTRAALFPSCASRMAATYPPGPEPMTTASKFLVAMGSWVPSALGPRITGWGLLRLPRGL